MIEGAIVALPFFILLFGIAEFGITFKAYLSLTAATNTSARAASTFGSDPGSDYFILRRINESGKAECLRGTFFTDSVRQDGAPIESWWRDLVDYVDQNYRTMGESLAEWTE